MGLRLIDRLQAMRCRGVAAGQDAARNYWSAEAIVEARLQQLGVEPDRQVRAWYLDDVADACEQMAATHGQVFAPGADAPDAADGLRGRARLARWVAATERGAAPLGEVGWPLPGMAVLARAGDPRDKAMLAAELAGAAVALFGSDAEWLAQEIAGAYQALADRARPPAEILDGALAQGGGAR